MLEKNRSCLTINACLDSQETTVYFNPDGMGGSIVSDKTENSIELQTRNLSKLLLKHKSTHDFDYLSIDIEGAEDRVIDHNLLASYSFKCISIERPKKGTDKLLTQFGYLKVGEIPELDSFYVGSDFAKIYANNIKRVFRRKWSVFRTI